MTWQGFGTQLLQHVLASAGFAGLVVTLSALKINPAVRLYRRLGFTTDSESAKSVSMSFTPIRSVRAELRVDAVPRQTT